MSTLMKSGLKRHRPTHFVLPHRLFAALAMTLALCPLVPEGARAGSRPKSLYMVSVGITNAQGHPALKATAKDALDMARRAQSQKDKLYGRVQVASLTNE